MCYASYKKCYTCPSKFDYHVVLCCGGKKALCCVDSEKVVNGEITVRVKVRVSTHDPDGVPRMCGEDTPYAVDDLFAAMMETREFGGDCPKCVESGVVEEVLVRSTPQAKRRKLVAVSRRKPLSDITSKVN
jgi:hypothetical protein